MESEMQQEERRLILERVKADPLVQRLLDERLRERVLRFIEDELRGKCDNSKEQYP